MIYFLPNERREKWVARLAGEFNLFLPVQIEGKIHWQKYDKGNFAIDQLALSEIRAAEPIKAFLYRPREVVATFPKPIDPAQEMSALLFGVKGCDLRGLDVHRKMFLEGEFRDPFYTRRLENTILVAADCPMPRESCFCNLVGLNPFVNRGVDLSITTFDDGWVIEAVSDRGEKLANSAKDLFVPAGEHHRARREEQRQKALGILEAQNSKKWNPELSRAIAEKTSDRSFWKKAGEDCVECFGCLMTCPTCFCFLLYDQAKAKTGADVNQFERTKVWDACYMAMYARVGGGANPRPEFVQRFINRFHCKFMHFMNQHGFYACSGCGRCFTACMGKIDIRNILGQL